MRFTVSPYERCEMPLAALLGVVSLLSACSSDPLTEPTSNATGGGSSQAMAGGPATSPNPDGGDYHLENYPDGPFGIGLGATMQNFAFMGWRDPAGAGYDLQKLETVRLSDFYRPGGETRLLWINASAVWCAVCRAEMKDIRDRGINATLGAKGLVMIETLFEDNDTNPAKPSDLKTWGSVHAIDFPLVLDPGFKLGVFFTSDATPLNMLVDAKSMQVLEVTMGYSSDYWLRVEQFLDR